MDRREFLKSAAVLSAGLPLAALPHLASADADATAVSDKIRMLEMWLSAAPGFSFYLHNELRHEYLQVSERMSRMHADAILAHSFMDDYVLNTLSDWHLTTWWGVRSPQKGMEALLDNAARYREFVYLRAACLTRAAEVCVELGDVVRAGKLLSVVASIRRDDAMLEAYRAKARAKLSTAG